MTTGDVSSEPAPQVVVREEQLEISSEWRPGRRYRVVKRVVEKEVKVVERLRREELVIEEVPISAVERLETVTGLASPSDNPLEAPPALTLVLREERLRVEKQVLPYERVSFNRKRVSASEVVEERVRKEEAHIERVPDRAR